MTLSLEDRFRFTLVLCFFALGLAGIGGMLYFSTVQAKKFQADAASLAVSRWYANQGIGLDSIISQRPNNNGEILPFILESNRVITRSLLPENLGKNDLVMTTHTSGEVLWVINKHERISSGTTLILGENEFPELKIAREAFAFQRWIAISLLVVLLGACATFFIFSKTYFFKPLHLLKDALLTRRLNAAAQIRQLHNAKITIERLEEQSRFPLEQFENDEFGQIAYILEDEDRRQKASRESWLKSFNTINEPIAVFGQNARLRHINEAMEIFLDEIGLDPDIVKNLPASAFLNSYLQLEEDASAKLMKVLNQRLPRLQGAPCNVELPEGSRNFRYSIATIVNHGERFAVFSLIREQVLGFNYNFEDVILEQANSQFKIIHKLQQTARDFTNQKSETLIHLCESLVDNIHSLLEISIASHPSLATHKVEFNIYHFFREIQESFEGALNVNLEIEKTLPTFIVGDPTHLRQFLKGIFQACHETNSITSFILNVGYLTNEKKLVISVLSGDGKPILRDPSFHLYISHYSPFLSLETFNEDEMMKDEFIRIKIMAQAGINRVESMELDLSHRQLPTSLIVVADELLPERAREVIESSKQFACKWLTPAEALEFKFSSDGQCMLLFINNTQKLKEKQIQKVINYARANHVPSILLSQQPRRGESLTALRLGFVTYLTLPFEHEELHKILILTMNKSVRQSITKLGLITKHTVRDLVPSLGKVLLGNIAKIHSKEALVLMNTLNDLGFRVQETSTVHSFFEVLHKGTFEYIVFPDGLSTGLKRRIQVSCRDIPCVIFGRHVERENTRPDDSSRHHDEGRNSNSVPIINWVRIEDVSDLHGVKAALETAQSADKTFTELVESEAPVEDDNELDLAI